MIRSLWIAKTGMEAQQTQLDTISHNLANVGTNGFKRGHVVFEDLIYQNLRQAGAASSDQTQLPTGLQVGLGVRSVATSRNFSQGNLQPRTTSTSRSRATASSRSSCPTAPPATRATVRCRSTATANW
jgi:flagellar basal-body rod protein FlgG